MAGYAWLLGSVGPELLGMVSSAGLALGHGACGLVLVLGLRHTPPAMRRVWRLCGASALSSSGIFAVWTYYAWRDDALPPALSLADAFFVTSVVLSLVAALSWPGVRGRRGERRRYVADGALLSCSLLLLSWSLVIVPTAGELSRDRPWHVWVPLLYPVLDVLAVAAAIYAVGAAAAMTVRAAVFHLAGIAVIAAGDAFFALQVGTGSWNNDPTTMVLWLLAFCLLVAGRFAGESPAVRSEVHPTRGRTSRTAVVAPIVPVFIALLVAVVKPANLGTVVLAGVLLLLVLVRYTLLGLSDPDPRVVPDLWVCRKQQMPWPGARIGFLGRDACRTGRAPAG